jgi:hypothetical protein
MIRATTATTVNTIDMTEMNDVRIYATSTCGGRM